MSGEQLIGDVELGLSASERPGARPESAAVSRRPTELLDRSVMERLSRRNNVHGLAYFVGHYALIGLGGWLCWATFPGPLFWPVFAFQTVVTGFLFSPLHECAHGSAFRSRWLNETALWITALVYVVPPLLLPILPSRPPPLHAGSRQGSVPRAPGAGDVRPIPLVLRRIVVLVAQPLVDGQARVRIRASRQCHLRAGRPARPDGDRIPNHGTALRGALRGGGALRIRVGAGGRLDRASRRRRAHPEDHPGGRARRMRGEPGSAAQTPARR